MLKNGDKGAGNGNDGGLSGTDGMNSWYIKLERLTLRENRV